MLAQVVKKSGNGLVEMPSLRTSHRAGWFQQSFLRYKLLLGYKLLHWFKFQVLSDNSHINAHHSSRVSSLYL